MLYLSLLNARVLVFGCFKRMKLKLRAKKTLERNRLKAKLNMLTAKKEYFLKTKNSSGKKGVRYEKQRSGLKCEVGEEWLKYLGKKYDLPISMVVSQQALMHVMKEKIICFLSW